MSGDWIKLHRGLLADGLWQSLTDAQRVAFIGLLLQVSWKESEYGCPKCGTVLKVSSGCTCKSYRKLAQVAGVSRNVMDRTITKLVNYGFLVNESRAKCHTFYRVKNWEKYQAREDEESHARDQTRDQTRDHARGQVEEVKKEKKEKKHSPIQVDLPDTENPARWALVDALKKQILAAHPNHSIAAAKRWKATRGRWKGQLDRAIERDGLTLEQIKEACARYHLNDWLRDNVDSMTSLIAHVDKARRAKSPHGQPQKAMGW